MSNLKVNSEHRTKGTIKGLMRVRAEKNMNRRSKTKASGINLIYSTERMNYNVIYYFSLYFIFFLFLKNEIYNVIQHEKNLSTQIILFWISIYNIYTRIRREVPGICPSSTMTNQRLYHLYQLVGRIFHCRKKTTWNFIN